MKLIETAKNNFINKWYFLYKSPINLCFKEINYSKRKGWSCKFDPLFQPFFSNLDFSFLFKYNSILLNIRI